MHYRMLVFIFLLASVRPVHAGDARGFVLASSCFNCHGPGGASQGSIPDISELSAVEIATSLKAFRDGTKTATVMDRLSRGYSDDEVTSIAEWLERFNAGGKRQ